MPHPIDRIPDPASERDSDRRLHDREKRESAAKTSDGAGSEPGDPKPPRIGEAIPDKKETEEAAVAASELFFQAAGLDKVPSPGQVNIAVKAAEIQAQRAEGISRGQIVTYNDARGETMTGGQYTRDDGTYFKTAQGLTFKVEPNQQNGFDLRSITGSSETFVAVRMDVLRDVFSAGGEKSKSDTPSAERTFEIKPEIPPPPQFPTEINIEPAVQANIASAPALEAAPDITSTVPFNTEPKVSPQEVEVAPQVVPPSEMGSSVIEGQAILEQAAQSVAIEKSEKELKEQEEAERLEREAIKRRIQRREERRRRRYVVKEKDTLDSIAIKQFKDVRLASLIYEINKHLIPVKVVRGRAVRELKPRLIIFLPTSADIEKFRFGQQPDTVAMDDSTSEDITEGQDEADIAVESVPNEIVATTSSATTSIEEPEEKHVDDAPAGSEPIPAPGAQSESLQQQAEVAAAAQVPEESDKRIYYSVRLGDTLKSIAVRQPSLSDPSLWALIAQVNGLSDAVDASGNPETKLVRGMRLALPTQSEIESFKEAKKNSARTAKY